MDTSSHRRFFYFSKNINTPILLVVSVVGLIAGISLSSHAPLSNYSLSSFLTKPTLMHLLIANLLLPAFVLLSMHCSLGVFCYPFVFADYLFRGFCGMIIYHIVGESSWLIRFLFMFSSYASSVVMWWFFFRCKQGSSRCILKNSYILLFSACLITVIDIFLISPLLEELIIYF